MDLWPLIADTSWSLKPASTSRLTASCRRSWKRRSAKPKASLVSFQTLVKA